MYSDSGLGFSAFIYGVLVIIMVITFFVIASRIKRIMIAVESLWALEKNKPSNNNFLTCQKCKREFQVLKSIKQKKASCPACGEYVDTSNADA